MGRVAPSIHRDAERASVLGSSETGEQGKRARGAKCHKVQTLSVIGVIITLVTSCWTSAFRAPAPAVPSSQQLAAISPGLIIIPLLQGRPGFWLPLRHCIYLPNFLDSELTADRQATLTQAAPSMA